jgi:hypothetical protein
VGEAKNAAFGAMQKIDQQDNYFRPRKAHSAAGPRREMGMAVVARSRCKAAVGRCLLVHGAVI